MRPYICYVETSGWTLPAVTQALLPQPWIYKSSQGQNSWKPSTNSTHFGQQEFSAMKASEVGRTGRSASGQQIRRCGARIREYGVITVKLLSTSPSSGAGHPASPPLMLHAPVSDFVSRGQYCTISLPRHLIVIASSPRPTDSLRPASECLQECAHGRAEIRFKLCNKKANPRLKDFSFCFC